MIAGVEDLRLDAVEVSEVLVHALRRRVVQRRHGQRVQVEQCCELVTVVGDGGVGKTRLVAEALRRIDAAVVRGRCLSYGDGITYWPVVEVVKQVNDVPSDVAAAASSSPPDR